MYLSPYPAVFLFILGDVIAEVTYNYTRSYIDSDSIFASCGERRARIYLTYLLVLPVVLSLAFLGPWLPLKLDVLYFVPIGVTTAIACAVWPNNVRSFFRYPGTLVLYALLYRWVLLEIIHVTLQLCYPELWASTSPYNRYSWMHGIAGTSVLLGGLNAVINPTTAVRIANATLFIFSNFITPLDTQLAFALMLWSGLVSNVVLMYSRI